MYIYIFSESYLFTSFLQLLSMLFVSRLLLCLNFVFLTNLCMCHTSTYFHFFCCFCFGVYFGIFFAFVRFLVIFLWMHSGGRCEDRAILVTILFFFAICLDVWWIGCRWAVRRVILLFFVFFMLFTFFLFFFLLFLAIRRRWAVRVPKGPPAVLPLQVLRGRLHQTRGVAVFRGIGSRSPPPADNRKVGQASVLRPSPKFHMGTPDPTRNRLISLGTP